MICHKCSSECVVASKRDYIPPGESKLSEIRVYVCKNLACLASFTYRNTFLAENKRLDAKKHLEAYERMKENAHRNQVELFEHE